nr:ATP-binding cassette domain-containing protein [Leucobacter sp.]
APDAAAPPGFHAATGDLENTSIALLTAAAEGGSMATNAHEQHRGRAQRPASPPNAALSMVTAQSPSTPAHRAGTHSAPLVGAVGIRRAYGTFAALDDVSLSVGPGEVVGLLGGNGAGKTTLMRILLGLETANAGSVDLLGGPPSLATRRRIGYVAQGVGLYPTLSAIENLEFAAAVQRVPVLPQHREFATGLGSGPTAALSLGTQRTLAYLAAIGHDPALLVLDEPTSGMDSLSRARLWRELRGVADQGTGILVTTHYMQEAAQCDRLVILTAGRVTTAGTAAEITSGHGSLLVESAQWQRAFTMLRAAGIPVLLHGRTLRVPGTDQVTVAAALGDLARLDGAVRITPAAATLEEAMLHDAAAAPPRSVHP